MKRASRLRRRPLSCRAVGRLLQTYLDGAVSDTSATLVANHLDDCRRCGLEADAYRWLIRSLVEARVPDDLRQLERLREFADALAAPS